MVRQIYGVSGECRMFCFCFLLLLKVFDQRINHIPGYTLHDYNMGQIASKPVIIIRCKVVFFNDFFIRTGKESPEQIEQAKILADAADMEIDFQTVSTEDISFRMILSI